MRRCTVLIALALLAPVLCGCSSRAGMSCLSDSDCRSGFRCARPPRPDGGTADMGAYGVCDEALKGPGETCLWNSECAAPLFCSNQIGVFTGDGRHGTCQRRLPADGGGGDLSIVDLPPSDLPVSDLGDAGAADQR